MRFLEQFVNLVGGADDVLALLVADDEVVDEDDGDGVAPIKKSSDGSSTLPK